jgi:hypothetical protein
MFAEWEIDIEFIKKLQKMGIKNLTPKKIIQAAESEILEFFDE